jgi:glutamyl-tRNA reductase
LGSSSINMIEYKTIKNENEWAIIIIGANHQSSTMLLRDRLYVTKDALPSFYRRLRNTGIDQAIILSTKDLTEFIIVTPEISRKQKIAEVVKLLSAHAAESRQEIESQIYILNGAQSVRHLFAVASGMDSLVIGDPELLKQLRAAYDIARDNNMTGTYLDTLFTFSEKTAERIIEETQISQRPVSIAAAAVQVARDLFGDLKQSSCLLLGGGEIGKMLASSMRSAEVGQLMVIHPSPARADTLGQHLNCHIGIIEDLADLLSRSDIVVTSMNTRKFILNSKLLKLAVRVRRRKPILVIDTGVPGDVEPSVENLEDIFFYTLDDLEKVTRKGRGSRTKEAELAWKIINQEVFKFNNTYSRKNMRQLNAKIDIETIRQEAIEEAKGDADKATRLLINRLKNLPNKEVITS